MKTIILFLRGITGLTNVKDGSTCEFSRRFFDVHDYKVNKGGDGIPCHFSGYKCSNCGKEFFI